MQSDFRVKGLMHSLNGGSAWANHGARTLCPVANGKAALYTV